MVASRRVHRRIRRTPTSSKNHLASPTHLNPELGAAEATKGELAGQAGLGAYEQHFPPGAAKETKN